MVFQQQQGGALSLACGPYPSTRNSPMNGTKLLRPHLIPLCYGLAVALVVGCAGPATRQLEKPTPDDEVSVGYGTQQKSNLTAAITSVSPTEAETRSEEHTSELQSQSNLVCRLLLEKKKHADYAP